MSARVYFTFSRRQKKMAVAAGEHVGRHLSKVFKGHGLFEGVVLAYDPLRRLYSIGYTDGDSEELTHQEVREVIYAQAKRVQLDGNVIELLSVRADFDRLSRMLATKVRALGEVLAARNQQKTDHICPDCQITILFSIDQILFPRLISFFVVSLTPFFCNILMTV